MTTAKGGPVQTSVTPGAGAVARGGMLISFRVAIITIVVGLLVVTCSFLLGFGIHTAWRSMNVLKGEYLEQVADTAAREVSRLPETAEQILRVQRFRIETGLYSTRDPAALARALAGALQTDPDVQWVSYSEEATGRFMRRSRGPTDPRGDPAQRSGSCRDSSPRERSSRR